MKREVAKREIESLDYYLQNHTYDYSEESHTAMMMAISALKDIEKIQTIIDNYFTIGRKSGYECMGEIDSILEPYKKGDGK